MYCDDAVLLAIHDTVLFNDSKTLVDMRLTFDPEIIVDALQEILGNSEQDQETAIEHWLDVSFDDPNSAFVDFDLIDWVES